MYPPFIEVEVVTRHRCPFNCIMCESSYWDEPDRDMTYNQFKSIVDQFPKLKWIGLTGIGEAFLNKDFRAMIALCKERNMAIEIYDLMFFDNTEFLIDIGVDTILVSLDAATAETYGKIRRGGNWDRSITHTKKLFQLAKQKVSETGSGPELLLHFIITTINKDEMIPFIDLAIELSKGINKYDESRGCVYALEEYEKRYPVGIQFTRILHWEKFPQAAEVKYECTEDEIDRVSEYAFNRGVTLKWGQNTWIEKPPMSDCIEWAMPFIFADGTVIPCCVQNLQFDRAYQRKTSLGNIFETPFKTLWKTTFKKLRKDLRYRKLPPVCVDCPLYERSK
jgi:MoaA/NifB/PqqE/SkfB family radical SAM enzyme